MTSWQDQIRAMAKPQRFRLEDMLTSRDLFGLVNASPVQRAVCRILDGEPLGDLEAHPDVVQALGGAKPSPTQPLEFVLLAGIRGGKSLISAACAVRAALTCDLSRLSPGETPRVPIVSLSKDTALATWGHVRGNVEASPVLRKLMPSEPTAEALTLMHPSGRPVEIRVVAGSKAAGSLVARWLAGAIFDEAPRMVGADEGVVNLDDARHAIRGRLLPGAQALFIGSPWAPFGPVYDMVQEYHGKPTSSIVVVRATGPQMNPAWWTPERCETLRLSNPDAYRVDVLCEFLAPESMLFTEEDIKRCTRGQPGNVPPQPGHEYAAAIDPATRGNSWTLVIATCTGFVGSLRRYSVVLARQWTGSRSEPISPERVFREMADMLKPYSVDTVATDQWAIDALRDIAERYGIYLREETATGAGNVEAFTTVHTMAVSGALELPQDQHVRTDLLGVRKRVTQTGITMVLTKTSDGRHCDYAPAIARVCSTNISPPEVIEKTEPNTVQWYEQRERERRARQQARIDADNDPEDSDWILGPG